jgi:Ribbon-helix-helix protein, copG family
MILKQIYLTEQQARTIKLRALREQKTKSQVIRELITRGLQASRMGEQFSSKDNR